MNKPLSLSLRIGLAVSIMGSALVVLIFSQSWLALRSQLEIIAESKLEQKLEQIEHSILEFSPAAIGDISPHKMGDLISGHPELSLLVCGADKSDSPEFTVGLVPRAITNFIQCNKGRDHYTSSFNQDGVNILIANASFRIPESNEEIQLTLISDRVEDIHLLAAYRNSTLMALPIFLIIIGMGAWWIVKRGLAPLNTFRDLTSAVTTNELKGRIKCQGLPSELNKLADSVNLMLERLENGVQQLSDFSDDLAHELRSPITNLMGKAQVALSRDRTSSQYKETLESCVEELERVSRIVSDMLYLAQTTQSDTTGFDTQSLNKEAIHIVSLFIAIAEEKKVRLSVLDGDPDSFIVGDKLMIQRAISNLLSNAIRHAPVDSTVSIKVRDRNNQVSLSVSNEGAGISEQHVRNIFKRFYRVDSGRARAEGGIGLGLAMVQSIMEFHQGSVTVDTSTSGPTVFHLWFPKPH